MQSRYFGGALLALGLLWFLARDTQDPPAIRAILVSGLAGDIAGAVISASAAGGLQNDMAWMMSVAIYAAFAVASAYYLVAGRRPVQPLSA